MARANRRALSGHRTHSVEGEYRIPMGYRVHKTDKWTKSHEKISDIRNKMNEKRR